MPIFLLLLQFPVSRRPRDYDFIDLVWEKSHDKIRLAEFVKDRKFPERKKYQYHLSFNYPSMTDGKEPQNALLLIVVQKQSFPREPILLYSSRLINNSKEDPSSITGLMSRPLARESRNCCSTKARAWLTACFSTAPPFYRSWYLEIEGPPKNNRRASTLIISNFFLTILAPQVRKIDPDCTSKTDPDCTSPYFLTPLLSNLYVWYSSMFCWMSLSLNWTVEFKNNFRFSDSSWLPS